MSHGRRMRHGETEETEFIVCSGLQEGFRSYAITKVGVAVILLSGEFQTKKV